ncbi:MAG: FecR domain-containing protein [Myxococcota bacterium]
MGSRRGLLRSLALADQALQHETLPPTGVRRIATRISRELDTQERRWRFGWIPMATFVAGAAMVLVFLGLSSTGRLGAPESDPPAVAMQVSVTGVDCRQRRGDGVELRGACEVATSAPSMRIETSADGAVNLGDRVVHVVAGTATFDVDAVHGEPVRVVTPGGEIVVVGTRFTVHVDGESGYVALAEGRIDFHDRGGGVRALEPGQRHDFGPRNAATPPPEPAAVAPVVPPVAADSEPAPSDEVATQPTQVAPKPRPRAKLRTEKDAATLIAEVEALRRAGNFGRAANRLERALRSPWPKRTREVLSNELGRILSRHLDDPRRACRHWRKHRQRFPASRFEDQIARSMNRLGCE